MEVGWNAGNIVKTKSLILIAVVFALAVVRYLTAGSAPIAAPAPVARQANVAPIAPSPAAPNGPVAPTAPIGATPPAAPVAPVNIAPIAPVAPAPSTPPQSGNGNSGYVYTYPYTYSYYSNSPYFSNGVPTGYLRNRNSVHWITNPPYGNPVSGYTNQSVPVIVRRVPPLTNNLPGH